MILEIQFTIFEDDMVFNFREIINFGIYTIIHPIHRFKSSDWLKEGHMTWIIFDNVHVWKLIHVC